MRQIDARNPETAQRGRPAEATYPGVRRPPEVLPAARWTRDGHGNVRKTIENHHIGVEARRYWPTWSRAIRHDPAAIAIQLTGKSLS